MIATFKLIEMAGMTNEMSDYLKVSTTPTAERAKDVLLSDRDFSDPYDFAELQMVLALVRAEMQ